MRSGFPSPWTPVAFPTGFLYHVKRIRKAFPGFPVGRRQAVRLLRGLVIGVLLICLFPFSPVSSEENTALATASSCVTLTYVPGAATNTLRVCEFNGQAYAVDQVRGVPCLFQTRKSTGGDGNWYFDAAEDAWSKRVGDGFLIIDFIASQGAVLNWFAYDSAFHSYNRLDQPPLSPLLQRDPSLGTTQLRLKSHGNHLFTAVWLLRKAFFGNRCGGAFDFVLNPQPGQFVGITRMTLRLLPVSRPPRGTPVDAAGLFQAMYRRLLGRPPKPDEQKMIIDSFSRGEIDFHAFLRRFLQTREFRQRNFRPFVRTELLDRLFHLLLHRKPTSWDKDFLYQDFDSDSNDSGITPLTEKYYPLIIETFIARLEAR